MFNELDNIYRTFCDVSMFDENRNTKPIAYSNICISVIERHMTHNDIGVAKLMKDHGVSLVLFATTVEIVKPLIAGDILQTQTWHVNREGICYRRELEIKNSGGETVAICASFSSLLDLETRHICRNEDIHTRLNLPEGKPLIKAQSRCKVHISDGYRYVDTFEIRPSMLDPVGHVNNLKYSEFLVDSLTDDERLLLARLKRFEMYYTGELTLRDTVTVYKKCESREITVTGIRDRDSAPAFIAKLILSEY